MKVAIQGIRGSFHHQAANDFFGSRLQTLECKTFREVFDAVNNHQADYGIVAVENSLHGPISSVYRLLANSELWVSGEVRLHIELYLISASQNPLQLSYYKRVISQAEALSQCEQWLADKLPTAQVTEFYDTAASVRQLAEHPNEPTVAVASKLAAQTYGAQIVAGPINDEDQNYTRFFIISKQQRHEPDANRTSIILHEHTSDKPGTLHDALGVFAKLGINLSKLDSHPNAGKDRTYSFYVDFDESVTSKTGKTAITELENQGWDVQILGSYKAC